MDSEKGVVSHLEGKKERKEHRMVTYKGIPTDRSKEHMEKKSEEFFDALRERKQRSIDFLKNAIKDSPEMEKVREEKKVDGGGVGEILYTFSEKDEEDEFNKRCRPKKKALSATTQPSPQTPGPHETPPATLGEAKKC